VKTTDEINVAKNAWMLWNILADLDSLLWKIYHEEFLDFEEEERMKNSSETV
jgi:hypothetical protein